MSQANEDWALDSSTVGEGVEEEFDCSLMGMEVNDCFNEEALRESIERRGRGNLSEFERREEVSNVIAILTEGGIKNEERDIGRVEQNCTGSNEVSVASLIDIVRARSGVIVIKEEVKVLKDRGVDGERSH